MLTGKDANRKLLTSKAAASGKKLIYLGDATSKYFKECLDRFHA